MYEFIEFIQQFQSKYPYATIKPTNNNDINFEYLLQHKHNISHLFTQLQFYPTETHKFEVFSFTLTSSIQDFWSAKAYELAFVIAAFSGAWPYIKLLLLLVIWLHPMKASLRRKGLLFLDQFGKFTFIDLYVMIFMAVSFYITISEQVCTFVRTPTAN